MTTAKGKVSRQKSIRLLKEARSIKQKKIDFLIQRDSFFAP